MNMNTHIYFEKIKIKLQYVIVPILGYYLKIETERNSVDVEVNKMDSYYR